MLTSSFVSISSLSFCEIVFFLPVGHFFKILMLHGRILTHFFQFLYLTLCESFSSVAPILWGKGSSLKNRRVFHYFMFFYFHPILHLLSLFFYFSKAIYFNMSLVQHKLLHQPSKLMYLESIPCHRCFFASSISGCIFPHLEPCERERGCCFNTHAYIHNTHVK